jgi:hypothetical protein
MQVVLYTDDMEAITVIDLPTWFMEKLHDGRMMRVAAPAPVQFTAEPEPAQTILTLPIVEIWAERFVRNGRVAWFLFTRNEEAALMLRSEPLPGQRKEFQDEYRRGFVRGLMAAFSG